MVCCWAQSHMRGPVLEGDGLLPAQYWLCLHPGSSSVLYYELHSITWHYVIWPNILWQLLSKSWSVSTDTRHGSSPHPYHIIHMHNTDLSVYISQTLCMKQYCVVDSHWIHSATKCSARNCSIIMLVTREYQCPSFLIPLPPQPSQWTDLYLWCMDGGRLSRCDGRTAVSGGPQGTAASPPRTTKRMDEYVCNNVPFIPSTTWQPSVSLPLPIRTNTCCIFGIQLYNLAVV